MSFQYVPSLFRVPAIPGFTPPNGIWRGVGGDEGYFAMRASNWGGYIMVEDNLFSYRLKIGDYVFEPVYSDVNGYIYWQGNGYIYFSETQGWVWGFKFPGYEPLEDYHWEEEELVWTGDDFYSFYSPPSAAGDTVMMTPRGALHGDEERELKNEWPRWTSTTEFGEYKGADGEETVRVLGLPKFTGDGETFVRSLRRVKGYFTYGRIRYANGKWLIGQEGSSSGWHVGSEPQVSKSVTFKFTKLPDSEAEGRDITVSFDRYIGGEETERAYLGSAAVWR